MATMKFDIHVDLGPLLDKSAGITAQIMPLLHQAVGAVAQATAARWQQRVHEAKLWSGEKDAYSQSINWEWKGDYSAEIVATYGHALEIETGRPARDLKKMLQTSMKVRRSKDGSRYLYIPFRHNTPGNDAHAASMPQSIYALAKEMAPSKIIGQTYRVSGQYSYGDATKKKYLVNQNVYSWGDRLPAGLAPKLKPHHKTDIYAGMYRFDTGTPGGAKSSAYLTFRTMSEKSAGWIVPPQPGLHLAQGVAEEMQPKAHAAFAEAIKRTLAGG